jgi:hypothetical protein
MSEQRIQTVKIVWKGDDAKGKVVEFTRSIKGTDAAVEELNKALGDNTTVTAKTVLSMKEAKAQAQKNFTAANRLVNQHNKLTEQLKQQIHMTSLSDDAQEVYAAQMRLGANATKEQKDEIARLITQLQAQRAATGNASGSMRNFRGIMQNAGWQLQDTIVQLQMGTSAMVVLSQQGSQFASAFGPAGAVVGALIAVTGAVGGLAIKMITGKKSTKELAESQKIINGVFKEGEVAADDLTESYRKLFIKNKDLAILNAQQAKFAAKDQMKAARDSLKKLARENFSLGVILKENQATYALTTGDIRRHNAAVTKAATEQAKKLGITIDQYKEINQLVQKGALPSVAEKLKEINKESGGVNRNLVNMAAEFLQKTEDIEDAATRIQKTQKITSGEITPEKPKEPKAKKTKTGADPDFKDLLIQIQKEIDLRKKSLSDIDESQKSFFAQRTDPRIVEQQRYDSAMKKLKALEKQAWAQEAKDKAEVNRLIENEDKRHNKAKEEAQLQSVTTTVQTASMAQTAMQSTVDLLSNGVEQIKAQTAEMNSFQKLMFLSSQALAATMAVINGISLGSKLAEMFPLAAPAMVTFGTTLGAANAGAIMGTTFAGAFDNGGIIQAGQSGIVSEYGDELVNGVMVKGPARITSREDTAKMMGSTVLKVNVVNGPGIKAEVQQLDENTVKIITAQYFNDNIDRSVAAVIDKKGSKTDKSMRKNYSGTQRNY